MKKLEILESVRGLAAIYVVFAHIWLFNFKQSSVLLFDFNLLLLLDYGQDAVMIFFVLSGFVIQHSFMNGKDKSFKLYFFKRFFRIYIPFIAVLLLTAFIQWTSDNIQNFSPKILIGNLLMLQDMPWRPGLIVSTVFNNYPLWSLSYEWWYYMLFYFMTMYLKRFSNSHFVYAFIIIAIISYHFYPHAINRWLLYLAVWWTGRDIAILYNTGRKISFRNLAIPLATILAGAMIMKLSVYTHGSTELSNFLNIEYSNLLRIFFVLIIAILWYKTGWVYYKYTLAPFKILAPISYH